MHTTPVHCQLLIGCSQPLTPDAMPLSCTASICKLVTANFNCRVLLHAYVIVTVDLLPPSAQVLHIHNMLILMALPPFSSRVLSIIHCKGI